MVIKKITDGQNVELSSLNLDELDVLHYEQELKYAALIKATEPFSEERARLLNEGYALVVNIVKAKKSIRNIKLDEQTYGANDYYAFFAEKIVNKVLKKKKTCIFFEAGVGTGKVLKSIASILKGRGMAIGCDVFVDPDFIDSGLMIYEGTIYDSLLKMEDNSIDVFYWNDVIEHIPDDEIDMHIKLIKEKMAKNGFIITITPNRLRGPCDITCKFEPKGSIAKGFHFHEYTFSELLALYQKHGMKSCFGVWLGFIGYFRHKYYIFPIAWLIDLSKRVGERIVAILPWWNARRLLLGFMACNICVVKRL